MQQAEPGEESLLMALLSIASSVVRSCGSLGHEVVAAGALMHITMSTEARGCQHLSLSLSLSLSRSLTLTLAVALSLSLSLSSLSLPLSLRLKY